MLVLDLCISNLFFVDYFVHTHSAYFHLNIYLNTDVRFILLLFIYFIHSILEVFRSYYMAFWEQGKKTIENWKTNANCAYKQNDYK